jgi:hypothetical protein
MTLGDRLRTSEGNDLNPAQGFPCSEPAPFSEPARRLTALKSENALPDGGSRPFGVNPVGEQRPFRETGEEQMTKEQEAGLRESLAGMDPLWVEEAITQAREMTDVEDITVTVVTSFQRRADERTAEVAALHAANAATEARQRAALHAMEKAEASDDHRGIVH